jgi:3-carboxy-cis,cis-muconate cycloisomerase
MPTSAIDSLVFRNMFGDQEVRRIWSDEYRTQCYLDWEAALARAQAGLGLIPQDAAAEINRVCKIENIDCASRGIIGPCTPMFTVPSVAEK